MYNRLLPQSTIKDTSGFNGKDIEPKTVRTTKTTTDRLIVKKDAEIDTISTNSISSSDIILNGRLNTTTRSTVNINGLININQAVYVLTTDQLVSELAKARFSGGKSIIVAPGEFIINNQLVVPANTDIRGSGINTTIFKSRSGFGDDSLVKMSSNSSITDLQLNGNGEGVNLLIADGVSNVYISLIKFTETLTNTTVSPSTISNPFIIENSSNINVTDLFFENVITNNPFDGNLSGIIFIGYGNFNLSFDNINFNNCQGIHIKIRYNTTLGNFAAEIKSIRFANVYFTNINTSLMIDIRSLSDSDDITDIALTNFYFSGNTGFISGSIIIIQTCSNITIQNMGFKGLSFSFSGGIFSLTSLNKIRISGITQDESDANDGLFGLTEVEDFIISDCDIKSSVQENESTLFSIGNCRYGIISRINSLNLGIPFRIFDSSNIKILDSNIISGDIESNRLVEIFTADENIQNILIKGCVFEDNGSPPVFNTSGSIIIRNSRTSSNVIENISIEGCTFNSNGTAINIDGPIKKLQVSGNAIFSDSSRAEGIALRDSRSGTLDADYLTEDIIIENNVIELVSGGEGVLVFLEFLLTATQDYTINNFSIVNNSLRVSGGSVRCIDVSINDIPTFNNLLISDNTISSPYNSSDPDIATSIRITGSDVEPNYSGVVISNNVIEVDYLGIFVTCPLLGFSIVGNSIVSNAPSPPSDSKGIYLLYVSTITSGVTHSGVINSNVVKGFESSFLLIDNNTTGVPKRYIDIKNNNFIGFENNILVEDSTASAITTSDFKDICILDNTMVEETSSSYGVFYTSHLRCNTSVANRTVTLKNILPKSVGHKCIIEKTSASNVIFVNVESGTKIAEINDKDETITFEWDGNKWGYSQETSYSTSSNGTFDVYAKRVGNVVTLQYDFTSIASPASSVTTASIPFNFRPRIDGFYRNAESVNSNSNFIDINVLASGSIRLARINFAGTPVNWSSTSTSGCVTYLAAN